MADLGHAIGVVIVHVLMFTTAALCWTGFGWWGVFVFVGARLLAGQLAEQWAPRG